MTIILNPCVRKWENWSFKQSASFHRKDLQPSINRKNKFPFKIKNLSPLFYQQLHIFKNPFFWTCRLFWFLCNIILPIFHVNIIYRQSISENGSCFIYSKTFNTFTCISFCAKCHYLYLSNASWFSIYIHWISLMNIANFFESSQLFCLKFSNFAHFSGY